MKTGLLLNKRWNFGVGTEDAILVKEASNSTTGLRLKALAAGEYVVDWGDGTVETRTIDSGTVGQYYYNTHKYSKAGRYKISFFGIDGKAAIYQLAYLSLIDTTSAKFMEGYVHSAFSFSSETKLEEIWLPSSITPASGQFSQCASLKNIYCNFSSGSPNAASAPWGATNATVHYLKSGGSEGTGGGGETGGGGSFPTTFSVTNCSGNGAAVGTYAKTANTTTVGGKDYPVYSYTQPILATSFYIYVCQYRQGASGAFWTLKADSYSASDEGYSSLGSVAAGADGLPSSTVWTAASSEATVSWS